MSAPEMSREQEQTAVIEVLESIFRSQTAYFNVPKPEDLRLAALDLLARLFRTGLHDIGVSLISTMHLQGLHQSIRALSEQLRVAECTTPQASCSTASIPMRLNCPGRLRDGTVCGALHIDEGMFAHKPHHTHSCQICGMTWRPAVECTVGVQFLPGFKSQ